MTPQQQADQIILRAERRLMACGYVNKQLTLSVAYDTVHWILTANPHGNPFNSDGKSTWKYWNEVLTIISQQRWTEK